jgi:CheY-like chemotaxis protein
MNEVFLAIGFVIPKGTDGIGAIARIFEGPAPRQEGELGVESVLGEGSLFRCRLKLGAAADRRASTARPKLRKCLVAVGDAEISQSLFELLSSVGAEPVAVTEAEQAGAALRQAAADRAPFDLVLIDDGELGDQLSVLIESDTASSAPPLRTCVSQCFFSDQNAAADSLCVYRADSTFLEALTAGHETDETSIASDEAEPFKDKQLLVVEDNRVNLAVIVATLKGFGCAVDTAENGEVAIERAEFRMKDGSVYAAGERRSRYTLEAGMRVIHDSGDGLHDLGSLTITSSLDDLYWAIASKFLFIIAMNFFKTLCILYVFYQLVGRHLHHLGIYLSGMNLDGSIDKFLLDRPAQRRTSDEFDQLV